MTPKNTAKRKGPIRDPETGRVRGGNPGNTGGKPGRSGRPPKAFKAFLAQLRQDPKVHAALERAAQDETCTNFRAALGVMTDYDDEKPAAKQQVDATLRVVMADE